MRKRATIVALPAPSNEHHYKVRCDDGSVHFMRGLGAPRGASLNDRGWSAFQKTANGIRWVWQPESMQERTDRMIRELAKGVSASTFHKLPHSVQSKIMRQMSRAVSRRK